MGVPEHVVYTKTASSSGTMLRKNERNWGTSCGLGIHRMTAERWFDTRPGKHRRNYGKIHHAINGKIHYFDWAMVSIAM